MTRFAAVAAAVVLAYGFSAIPAFAGPGLVLQGVSLNGIQFNGFRLNGGGINGINFNGLRLNGATEGTKASPRLQGLTLADGTALAAE